MQHKAVYLLFCKFILHVSGVNHTHHQEYKTLTTASRTASTSLQRGQASLTMLKGGSCTKNMTSSVGILPGVVTKWLQPVACKKIIFW